MNILVSVVSVAEHSVFAFVLIRHSSDTSFTKTFLLTYKSFADLNTLFELLVQRFWIKPPENLNPQEFDEWTKLKQHVIRMRLVCIFFRIPLD